MSLAVVMTVKNERSFLRMNVLYHRFMGADVIYVYDDGSTDGGLESVGDLPFVRLLKSVTPDQAPNWPSLTESRRRHATFFVARQILNAAHAMELARAEGVNWLLALDADELAATSTTHGQRDAVRDALESLPTNVEMAVFRPLEVVQRRTASPDVMATETQFKRLVPGATRQTYDPFTKQTHRIRTLYGHTSGKSAIRLSVGDAFPHNPHRFYGANDRKLRASDVGYLLHYYVPDFESFVHKFRGISTHPDRQLHGREVVVQKRVWRDVVNQWNADETQLHDYYDRWVAFSDEEIEIMATPRRHLLRRREPLIVEVTSARDVIRSLPDREAAP